MNNPRLVVIALAATLLQGCVAASALPQDTSTTPTNKADNPKKPSKAKNPSATEKPKTDDRLSTRGLTPPPKDADKDKTTKPDAKSSSTTETDKPKPL